jgi:tetratricopeptide (TPR) repeat protein
MSLSFRPSILSLLLLVPTAFTLGAADPAPATENAWESASTFRSNEAYAEFSKAGSQKGANLREVSLGQATALIGVQPKTASNIDKAAQLCHQLIEENPNDNIGLMAAYLLARIEQYHRQPTNPKKAEEIYQGLLRDHSDSLVAQIASSKLAVLTLFVPNTSVEQKQKALADMDVILPKVTMPEARSNTLIAMGNACVMFDLGDEKALRYLIEAEASRIASAKTRADTLIQIGTIAQRLNKKDVAMQYYAKFVDQYKRDTRNYMVRQKMAELKSGS